MADTKHDDGGHAYPNAGQMSNDGRQIFAESSPGMTLLDYFAGQAMDVMGNNLTFWVPMVKAKLGKLAEGFDETQLIPMAAYGIADAMIAEKRRREKEGA